jgi:hypothetical protein
MFCSWLQQNGSEGRILSPAPRQGLLQKERNVLIPAAASLLRRANSVPHMAPIQGFRCEKEQHKHKAMFCSWMQQNGSEMDQEGGPPPSSD